MQRTVTYCQDLEFMIIKILPTLIQKQEQLQVLNSLTEPVGLLLCIVLGNTSTLSNLLQLITTA